LALTHPASNPKRFALCGSARIVNASALYPWPKGTGFYGCFLINVFRRSCPMVPILDRPGGQSLLLSQIEQVYNNGFQSSIAPEGNRYYYLRSSRCITMGSNPRSPRRAIATQDRSVLIKKNGCSNPRSPRRAIATPTQPITFQQQLSSNPRSPRRAIATFYKCV
jgi:hypothetical protein